MKTALKLRNKLVKTELLASTSPEKLELANKSASYIGHKHKQLSKQG